MIYKIYQKLVVQILCFLCMCVSTITYADIDEIRARGKLRIGVSESYRPPFYYKNKKGELVGVDIDFARIISKELGVEPEFIIGRQNGDQGVRDIDSDKVDITCSIIITPQRSLSAAFSLPYIAQKPTIVLNRFLLAKTHNLNLVTLNQILADPKFKIFSVPGTAYNSLAKKLFNKIGAKIYEEKEGVGLHKVLKGEAFAYVTHEVEVENYILKHPEDRLRIISYHLAGHSGLLGIPVSYKNPILLSLVNSIIETRKMRYATEEIIEILENIKTDIMTK